MTREVCHVDRFVTDGNGDLTHLVVQRAHLLGKRVLAIPIEGVMRLGNDLARLALTADEISRFPDPAPRRHRRGAS